MLLMIVVLALMIPILAILLDSQVGRAIASRLERRGLGEGDGLVGERMAYLETEVERLATELARLDEESRFVTRLLTERAEGQGPPPALPGSSAPAPGPGDGDA